MAEEPLKSADEWLSEYPKLVILDPDGWRGTPIGFEAAWKELITRAEFEHRVSMCTCKLSLDMFKTNAS